MTEVLPLRSVDPDDGPVHRAAVEPTRLRLAIESTIVHGLMKAYPVASVVHEVDDRFARLLEAMADVDLGGGRKG